MGIFFGHSTYKTEPSEKISAWHDFFSGLGCHFSFNDWTKIPVAGTSKQLKRLFL